MCVDAYLNRDRYSLYQKYQRLQSLLVTVVQELEWLSSQVRTDKDRIPLLRHALTPPACAPPSARLPLTRPFQQTACAQLPLLRKRREISECLDGLTLLLDPADLPSPARPSAQARALRSADTASVTRFVLGRWLRAASASSPLGPALRLL